jgi:preprotein translocase subunit SecE
MTDKLKLLAAMLIVVTGIGAFYYFGDKPGYVQLVILLVSGIAAVVVFLQTAVGQAAKAFGSGAIVELRKVVWPTQKETMQVTLIVFVMAVLVALFLWAVDWGLHKIVKTLTA